MDKVFASVLLLWVLFLGLRLVAVAFQRIFEGTAGGTRVILQSWHQIDLPFRRLMLFMVGGASLLIVSGTLKPLLWQLEEAVQDQPYTGWSFAGLCLGVTISAFIRWQLFSWPQIGDKSPRVHTLDAIRVGARLAKRQLVAGHDGDNDMVANCIWTFDLSGNFQISLDCIAPRKSKSSQECQRTRSAFSSECRIKGCDASIRESCRDRR